MTLRRTTFSSAAALAMGRAMQAAAGGDEDLSKIGANLEARALDAIREGRGSLSTDSEDHPADASSRADDPPQTIGHGA